MNISIRSKLAWFICLSCIFRQSGCQITIVLASGQTQQVPLASINQEGYLSFHVKADLGTNLVFHARDHLNGICLKYKIKNGNTHLTQYNSSTASDIGVVVEYNALSILDWGSTKLFWASWEADVMKIGLGNTYGEDVLASLPVDSVQPFCTPQTFWLFSDMNLVHPSETTFPNKTLAIPAEAPLFYHEILTDENNDTCVQIEDGVPRIWGIQPVLRLNGASSNNVASYGEAGMPCGRHGIQLAINSDHREAPWSSKDVYLKLCKVVNKETVDGAVVCSFACPYVAPEMNTNRFIYILNKHRERKYSVCEVFVE